MPCVESACWISAAIPGMLEASTETAWPLSGSMPWRRRISNMSSRRPTAPVASIVWALCVTTVCGAGVTEKLVASETSAPESALSLWLRRLKKSNRPIRPS
jgi:hypothetical protein